MSELTPFPHDAPPAERATPPRSQSLTDDLIRLRARARQGAAWLNVQLGDDPASVQKAVGWLESRGWRGVAAVYFAAAMLLMINCWTGFPEAVVGGGEQPDWAGTMWAYWWTGHALMDGQSPFNGTGNFFPIGQRPLAMYNLTDAFLATPFVHLLGPILGFNMFSVFILWSTGMGVSAVGRASGGSHGASLMAGLAIISSTYMVMELVQGRQSQALLVFWMLGLAGLVRLAKGEGSWKLAVATGAAVAATHLTYWYAGMFLSLAAAPYWLAHIRQWDRARWGRVLLAAVVTVVLCGPALWALAEAYRDLPGVERELDDWMDYGYLGRGEFGLNMVIRGSHWPLWPIEYASTAELADRRISYGLLGLALGGLWLKPRVRLGWWMVLLWGYLLSLGPYLKWSDGLPLPYALPYLLLYEVVPFFERLWWPDRLDIIVFVSLAILAALHVDVLRRRWPKRQGMILIGAVILVFVDVPWRNRFVPLMVGKTRPVAAELYEQIDGPVLTTPVLGGEMVRHILWMQVHHEQPTSGGLGEHLPAHRPPGYQEYIDNNQLLTMLAAFNTADTSGDRIRPRAVQALLDDGLRWAVVDPWTYGDPNGQVAQAHTYAFYQLWGEPDLTEDKVMAWRIEPIMAPVNIKVSLQKMDENPQQSGGGKGPDKSGGKGPGERGTDGQR